MWGVTDACTALLLAQGETSSSPFGSLGGLFPFIAIGLLFYFMLLRPERKKRSDMEQVLENLKKNDRVVTIGGIFGVIVNVQKGAEDVTLRIDDTNNTRLRVLRSAIARVITEEGSDQKDSD
ncbi:MAG TPA: preprotein translocase subunit YajC [Nitrospiraceae bacterium]|nr:preprotein translocase subunit YajC [Nitrospiraceae bacterium]